MIFVLALLLALNPGPNRFHLQGWVVEVCKYGEPCHYTPAPFPTLNECEQFRPWLEQHSNFRGWEMRCIYVDGDFEYPARRS